MLTNEGATTLSPTTLSIMTLGGAVKRDTLGNINVTQNVILSGLL
jgi:hypothetical protein